MNGAAISRQDLLDGLKAVGLRRGDVLYVGSSLAALGVMHDPLGETLWALREAVGPDGTLVMPTFNFGFCRGEPFDVRHTPSECGQLTEAFRTSPGAVRNSSPPYHTVAAIGPRAAEIGTIESVSSFSRVSVFQYLHDVGARHLLIGCGYDEGVPHVHWLEELNQVPYRYWKTFEGQVVVDGRPRQRTFRMYARRLDLGVQVDADPLGMELEKTGAVSLTTVGLCKLRAFDVRDLAAFAQPRFEADPLIMLKPACRHHFVGSHTTRPRLACFSHR